MTQRRSRSVQATLAGIERLEFERRKRGLTLEALARSANVAPDTLKRLSRRQKVDRNSIRDIVGVLELEPTDIVDNQEWNQWYGVESAELDSSERAAELEMPEPPEPEPPAAPDFSFYIPRPTLETVCQEALASGGLLRIKAPQQMGKTSLLTRLLWQAEQQGYQTVCLSFQLADSAVFANLNSFLQWFCAVVSRELGLADQLESAWKEIYSGSYNATAYFQDYLLKALDQPLVLALDNTDLVFEHEAIAADFCKLLRNWHDLPRRSDRHSPTWQKLRLIIVHATEIYGALDINASPLAGVGLLIDLPEFSFEQVQDLVQRYGFDWQQAEIQSVIDLVGGHPYLLRLGLEQIRQQQVSLKEMLETAASGAGAYGNHLRQQLSHLEQSPELIQLFRAAVLADLPIQVKPAEAFKLQSMGLVQMAGNQVRPRCQLYRQYFLQALPD